MRNDGVNSPATDGTAESAIQFHVGRAAMVAAAVMVLVSGYTTAKGLLDIVGWAQLYIVVMAAIVVQGMLAIAAWFLGKELARYVLRSRLGAGIEPPSAPLTAVTASIFLATFCASFFFAFSFWYNELRSLSQRTEEARQLPNTFQTIVMKPLLDAVKDAREGELKEPSKAGSAALSNDPTQAWLGNLALVIKTAQEARGEIQERVNAAIKKRQNDASTQREAQQARAKEIRDIEGRLREAQRSKGEAQREISETEALLLPFEREMEPLRKQRDQFEQERLKECAGIEGRKTGCGPKADAAERSRNAVQTRINQIEGPLKPDRDKLVRLQKKLAEADAAVATQSRTLEGQGVPRDRAASASGDAGADSGLSGLEGLLRMAATLDDRRQDFLRKGTPEAYGAAVQACAPIVLLLTEAQVAKETVSQLSCESSTSLQRAETRPQRDAARGAFNNECSPEKMSDAARQASALVPTGEQRVDAKILSRSFNAINGKIESCINIAIATGANVSTAEDLRSKFAQSHAPDRDRFQEAFDGLWNGGAHRTAAVGIAAIFDLMILGLAFFADLFNIRRHTRHAAPIRRANIDLSPNDDDAAPLAGAKALRRYARYDVGSRKFIADLNELASDDTLSAAAIDNVDMRMGGFLQARLADPLKDGRYVLSDAALADLESYIDLQQQPAGMRQPVASSEEAPQDASVRGASAPAMPGAIAGGQAGQRNEPGPATPNPNRKLRQASDLTSVPWRRPVGRAAQRRAAPEPEPPFAGLRSAPTSDADDVFGIGDLMNRERRES